MRLGEQQCLVDGDLCARDLDNLCRQPATVVERGEAAWAEQALEPAIAHQKCTLIVLDDDLELEQHDTFSNQVSSQSVTTCSAGRRLQSRTEATGQRLSPRPHAFALACVRADPGIGHAGAE